MNTKVVKNITQGNAQILMEDTERAEERSLTAGLRLYCHTFVEKDQQKFELSSRTLFRLQGT